MVRVECAFPGRDRDREGADNRLERCAEGAGCLVPWNHPGIVTRTRGGSGAGSRFSAYKREDVGMIGG